MCKEQKKFEYGTNFFLILVQHGGANILTGLAHIAQKARRKMKIKKTFLYKRGSACFLIYF